MIEIFRAGNGNPPPPSKPMRAPAPTGKKKK